MMLNESEIASGWKSFYCEYLVLASNLSPGVYLFVTLTSQIYIISMSRARSHLNVLQSISTIMLVE